MKPLSGPDAQALDLLLHVVAIGRHRGTFTAETVVRTAYAHLPHAHVLERRLRDERARADRAEAEVQRLRGELAATRALIPNGVPWNPPQPDNVRTVQITAREAEVLAGVCRGKRQTEIAEALGITPGNVSTVFQRAASQVGARNQIQAVALLASGAVDVVIKPRRGRAA